MIEIVTAIAVFCIVFIGGFLLIKRKKEHQFWELQKQLECELYGSGQMRNTI